MAIDTPQESGELCNMKMLFRLLPLPVCMAIASLASAQSIGPAVINPGGGGASVSNEVHEYAVGQLTSGESGTVGAIVITPEVLQPQIQPTGMIEQISETALKVFPNPASTALFLQPALLPGTVLQYALSDAAGQIVTRGNANLMQGTERQALRLDALTPGVYHLKTFWTIGGNQYEASFKVQKQ